MSDTFHPSPEIIEPLVEWLKTDGVVCPEATFNYDAPGGMRREVAYRDGDLAYRMGQSRFSRPITDETLSYLKARGLVPSTAGYDDEAFCRFRDLVHQHFCGSWTSITPVMERLLYMLTSVRRPQRMIEFGCFWGNTLAWFVGPCLGSTPAYIPEVIYGVDNDTEMLEQARHNFSHLPNNEVVQLLAEDAREAVVRLPGPFDMVYLEAKSSDAPHLYLTLVQAIYDRLPKGAWVLAHDIFDPEEIPDLIPYMNWVRDEAHFATSIAFDVDNCGLELSIK